MTAPAVDTSLSISRILGVSGKLDPKRRAFWERLEELARLAGLSPSALTLKAGVGRSYASGIKVGRIARPSIDTCERLVEVARAAGVADVTATWLMTGSGPAPGGAQIVVDEDSHRNRALAIDILKQGGFDNHWAIDRAKEEEHRGASVQFWVDRIFELHTAREKAFARLQRVAESPERKKEKEIFDAEPAAKRTKRRSSGTMSAVRGPAARGKVPFHREEERPRTFTRERR